MPEATTPPVEVPGYEILEEIGRGGHAIVYRARQVAFDRIVALKLLARLDLDGQALRRFERECKSAGALSWHPHIVVVYDAGTTGQGLPYLAMEYLERGSLAQRVEREGPLRPDAAASIGVQLAGALEAAHRAGMLHRDVKPENVLVGTYGEAKLGDFGIAAVGDHTVTATGIVTATVAHAAPEILGGRRATASSDVYSLGSTLYTLLTGQPPFVGSEESIVGLIARVSTEPLPDLRPRGVPDDLARVVEAATAKDPAWRPASAEALGRMLQEFQRAAGLAITDMRIPTAAGTVQTVAPVAPSETPPPAVTPAEPPLTVPAPPARPAEETPPPTPTAERAAALPRRSRRNLVGGAVVLALLTVGAAVFALTSGGGSPGRPGEVVLLAAGAVGADPFTEPASAETVPDLPPSAPQAGDRTGDDPVALQGVHGSRAGLYADARGGSACDRDSLVSRLGSAPERSRAWAPVVEIDSTELTEYVAGLTPGFLTEDVRVTDHAFRGGEAVARQAVLQQGTAVLVDRFGVPRVRCRSGNPLRGPEAVASDVTYLGDPWASFDAEATRVIVATEEPVDGFVLVDLGGGPRFGRPVGTAGDADVDQPQGDGG